MASTTALLTMVSRSNGWQQWGVSVVGGGDEWRQYDDWQQLGVAVHSAVVGFKVQKLQKKIVFQMS